jgi:glycerol-3-phosphate cytidylyltransferase
MRVLTIGTWDLFHEGHVNLLKKCRHLSKNLIVGVNSDSFTQWYKGRPPHVPQVSRMQCVRAYGVPVLHDPVVSDFIEGYKTPEFIERYRPDLIVVGSDWATKDYYQQLMIPDHKWLTDRGISLMYAPYTESTSSTMIRSTLPL